MGRGSEQQPGSPGGPGAPVKRAEADESIPDAWLSDPANRKLGEAFDRDFDLDRLGADNELVQTLAFGNFEGTEWEYFSTELAKYGIAVIASWMRRGLIFGRCRERGFGGLSELGRDFTDDEIDELTWETIAKALFHFRRDILMKQKWDYQKGATLRTYFIGQCLIRFANIFRRWWGGENRNRYGVTDDMETLADFGPRVVAADRQVVDRTIAIEALSTLKNTRVRKAMLMTAQDRSQAEIAVELGVTEKAVERMLANERARQRKREAG
jgi:DNA-directed RNA polymerase specialized sigma24 family protein